MRPPYPVTAPWPCRALRPLGLAFLPWAAAEALGNLPRGRLPGRRPNRKALMRLGRTFLEYTAREDYALRKEAFLDGLDAGSRSVAEAVLGRFLYLAQHDDQPQLSPEERRARWSTYQELCAILPRYRLAAPFHEPSVFNYHCGLAALGEESNEKARRFLRGRGAIDAGAFIGDSALVLAREYGLREVWAFEPEEENYRLLRETVSLNHEIPIRPVRQGLSDAHGLAGMVALGSASRIGEGGEGAQRVPLTTVDEFVRSGGLDVGLIKMDIEGYESKAVLGARQTIAQQKPILLISIYHNPTDFFEIKPRLEALGLGYRFFVRKLNPHEAVYETMLIGLPREF